MKSATKRNTRQSRKPKPPARRAAAVASIPATVIPMPAKRMLLARQSDGLSPRSLDEALRLAERLADSQLVPKEYRNKPADILIAISLGHEVGLKWAQALQNIAVIGGRPTVWGDAGLGIVMSHPDYEWHRESDDEKTETATCTMKRRGLEAVTRTFSQADAERIMVYERDAQGQTRQVRLADRPVWKAGYKKRMRQMRARWWAMKDTFADALKGIEGREWVEDDLSIREGPALSGAPLTPETFMPRRRDEPPAPTPESPVAKAGNADLPMRPMVHEDQPSSAGGGGPMRSETQPGPAHAEPKAERPEAAAAPPASVTPGALEIEINGRKIMTAGITKETLLKCYRFGAQLDELEQKGAAKDLLGREFGLEHRTELTEPTGQRYLAELTKRVNRALAARGGKR